VVRKILLDTGTRGEYRALTLVGASTECLERAVPRYFLDLVDGDQRTIDRTGIIADDLECAEHTAEGAARDFMVSKLLRDEDLTDGVTRLLTRQIGYWRRFASETFFRNL
jgi:hypothetical protein